MNPTFAKLDEMATHLVRERDCLLLRAHVLTGLSGEVVRCWTVGDAIREFTARGWLKAVARVEAFAQSASLALTDFLFASRKRKNGQRAPISRMQVWRLLHVACETVLAPPVQAGVGMVLRALRLITPAPRLVSTGTVNQPAPVPVARVPAAVKPEPPAQAPPTRPRSFSDMLFDRK